MSTFEQLCEQSEWHFDWFSKERNPYFARILCRFIGEWDPAIKIKSVWQQDEGADDDTVDQYKEAKVPYSKLYLEGKFDEKLNADYLPMIQAIGLDNPRILIHVQQPGQMHPLHMDKTYGGGHWDYLGDTKHEKLGRVMIMLDDWHPGQVILMGNDHFIQWRKGDVIYFRWQDMPHGTCNFGLHDRPMLFVTGEITDKFKQLLDSKEKTEIKI